MMKQAACITTSARMFAVFPCTRHYTGVSLLWHYLCASERCIWSLLERLHFTALCPGLPGWASTRRNIHPPTYPDYQPIFINFLIYHDPQHPPCYVFDNLFAQLLSISMSSLVYLLLWSPPPHTPYISLTQSVSSFCNTCRYHWRMFCCSTIHSLIYS